MTTPHRYEALAGRRALVIAHEPDGPAGQIKARLVQQGFVVDTHIDELAFPALAPAPVAQVVCA